MATTTAVPEQTESTQAPTPEPQPTIEQPRAMVVSDNRPAEIQKFEFQQRCARLFAASGLFADIKGQGESQSIAQAFVKIALGDSMGFNPAESMTGIDIIQGRVSVGSSLRAARMQRAGYSWDILQLDDKGCRLRMRFKGAPLMCEQIDDATGEISEVPAIVSFMVEDAARAGLAGKDTYKKNPRNMFFARAITNAQRWYAPGILGVDILSTEEAIDMEPATQDNGLAAKATSVANGIKERYAKKSGSEGASVANASANPPVGESPETTALPEQLSPEEQKARNDRLQELLQQSETVKSQLSKKHSANQGTQHGTRVDFGEGK